MKKYTFILIALAFWSSCKEEDVIPGGGGIAVVGVEGVWNFESMEQQNGVITLAGIEMATYTSKSSNEQGTFEYKADGTLTSAIGYVNTQIVTTAGFPNTTTQDIPVTTTEGTYEYDAAAKTLKMTTSTGLVQEGKVTELSASKMVFEYALNQETTNAGVTTVTTADVVIEFSK